MRTLTKLPIHELSNEEIHDIVCKYFWEEDYTVSDFIVDFINGAIQLGPMSTESFVAIVNEMYDVSNSLYCYYNGIPYFPKTLTYVDIYNHYELITLS